MSAIDPAYMCSGSADANRKFLRVVEVPLIQDAVTELSSDTQVSDPHTSWNLAAPSRPRKNRFPRSARLNGAPTMPCETVAMENRSRSSSPTESTFLFSRRARAFRTYFIQQLDDYQFLTPFSTRMSTESAHADPTHALSNPTPVPESNSDTPTSDAAIPSHNDSPSSNPPPSTSGLQLPFSEAWQRACQTAMGLWGLGKVSLSSPFPRLAQWGTKYTQPVSPDNEADGALTPLIPQTNDTHTETHDSNKTQLPTQDLSTDAAGRHSSELQGSCMAVVIGLVAGIIWF